MREDAGSSWDSVVRCVESSGSEEGPALGLGWGWVKGDKERASEKEMTAQEWGYSRPGASRMGLRAPQGLPPETSQTLPEQRTGEVRPCWRQRSQLSLGIEALTYLGLRAVSGARERVDGLPSPATGLWGEAAPGAEEACMGGGVGVKGLISP